MRFLLPLLLLPSLLAAQDTIPAFPEARGWGATALAPCRALPVTVHMVTDTATSGGAGTFRDVLAALSDTTYDIVVFRTGGRTGRPGTAHFSANADCVRIAGETAPGGGFTIATRRLNVGEGGVDKDHWVVTGLNFYKHDRFHFRVKTGVLDHISCAWSGYTGTGGSDCITIGQGDDGHEPGFRFTVSNTLIAEPHTNHATGLHVGRPQLVSVYRNFMMSGYRVPMVQVDSTSAQAGTAGAQIANNVVYNWIGGANALAGVNNQVVDFIGNYAMRGPGTSTTNYRRFPLFFRSQCAEGSFCVASNYLFGNASLESAFTPVTPADSAWRGSQQQYVCQATEPFAFDPPCPNDGDDVPLDYKRDVPLPTHLGFDAAWPYVEETIGDPLRDDILSGVGNSRALACNGDWFERRGPLDSMFVQQFYDNTGRSSQIDFQPAGGTTTFPDDDPAVPIPDAGTPCPDVDLDGMPDAWESLVSGSSTGVTADSVSVSGYLMIEHYLNNSDPDDPEPWVPEPPPTFTNFRFVYLLPVDTIPFGTDNLLVPDTTVIPRNANKVSIYNPAQDSVLTVTCQSYGASADSVTVDVRSRAWDRQGMRSAAEIRNRPLSALSC